MYKLSSNVIDKTSYYMSAANKNYTLTGLNNMSNKEKRKQLKNA
jgi:hypothetical protein